MDDIPPAGAIRLRTEMRGRHGFARGVGAVFNWGTTLSRRIIVTTTGHAPDEEGCFRLEAGWTRGQDDDDGTRGRRVAERGLLIPVLAPNI